MEKARSGASAHSLDARLLRFRNRPNSDEGRMLAQELIEAGRHGEAVEVTAIALADAPEDAGLHLLEGQAWIHEGDLIRAQAALLRAARAAPNAKEPFRWLGEVLLKRGDPQRAVKVLDRARSLDPKDAMVTLLHQRAERFARIAKSEGEERGAAAAKQLFETRELDDEATVVSPDAPTTVTDAVPRAPAPSVPSSDPAEKFEEEEAPTTVADRSEIDEALAKAQQLDSRPPARAPRSPKRTMLGFGAATDTQPAGAIPQAPPSPLKGPQAPGRPIHGAAPKGPPAPPSKGPPTPPPAGFPPRQRRVKRTMVGMGGSAGAGPRGPASPGPHSATAGVGNAPRVGRAAFDEATTDAWVAPERGPSEGQASGEAAPTSAGVPAPRPSSATSPPALGEPLQDEGDIQQAPPFTPPQRSIEDRDRRVGDPAPHLAGRVEPAVPVEEEETFRATPLGLGAELRNQSARARGTKDELQPAGTVEPPGDQPSASTPEQASGRPARRRGWGLAVACVLVLGVAAGGWLGWQAWIEHQHAEAARMVDRAAAKAREGDHIGLVDAERGLRAARQLDPHGTRGPTEMLFVHAQRALEDGAFEPGNLGPSIQHGQRMQVDAGRAAAAAAVLAVTEGDVPGARRELTAALEAGPEDPVVLYMAGRVKQRLGDEDAAEHLARAVEREPRLAAAAIALAELRAGDDQDDAALGLLDGVLLRYPGHLRATLWKQYLTTDEVEPDRGLARLDELEPRLETGAPTDQVLVELTRARLLSRTGQTEEAADAVERTREAGITDPRLMALIAADAMAVGRLDLAQEALSSAVEAAPSNAGFRKLLAQALLEDDDGVGALSTLAELPGDDPEVLRMSAEAALLIGTEEALAPSAEALTGHLQESEAPAVTMRALRIRTMVALGRGPEVLDDARALVGQAPDDPIALRALGEAALAADDAETASDALVRLAQAAPNDADAHHLLGRAHRLAGDAEAAEVSFGRALELAPHHIDAGLAMGRLLLERGEHAQADQLYQGLTQEGAAASGEATALVARLGRVEALIGLGRLDEAATQLEELEPQGRQTPHARVVTALLALARHQPEEAVEAIRPLAEADNPSPEVLAMYGDALFDTGEVEEANRHYEAALELDPSSPEALVGKARVAVRAENSRDARSYLDRVATSLEQRIRPPRIQATIHMLRGRSFLQEGRRARDGARSALREAVAIESAPAEAWFWLGEALSGQNAPEAREAYQRYLTLEPEGPYASRAQRAVD